MFSFSGSNIYVFFLFFHKRRDDARDASCCGGAAAPDELWRDRAPFELSGAQYHRECEDAEIRTLLLIALTRNYFMLMQKSTRRII